MKKSKLTIVCYNQFGYLTDTFEYCRYLRDFYEIDYICIDYAQPKLVMDGVNVIYAKDLGKGGIKKWLGFYNFSKKHIDKDSNVIFVKYFLFSSLLSFSHKNALIDVRTGSVKRNPLKRFIENFLITGESLFFKHRTIISKSLQKLIWYPKATILPLGANLKRDVNRPPLNDCARILYVGTLSGRNIHEVIIGLREFIDNKQSIKAVYLDIVGDGYSDELEKLKSLTMKLNLGTNVTFHGRIPYEQTIGFYNQAHIGLSYVPKTAFFDVQPVTKTFEYLAAGLPVIGTSTSEQKCVLDSTAYGVLCDDTPNSFASALGLMLERYNEFEPEKIIEHVKKWEWREICKGLYEILINLEKEGV